jgi:hypothetical protein
VSSKSTHRLYHNYNHSRHRRHKRHICYFAAQMRWRSCFAIALGLCIGFKTSRCGSNNARRWEHFVFDCCHRRKDLKVGDVERASATLGAAARRKSNCTRKPKCLGLVVVGQGSTFEAPRTDTRTNSRSGPSVLAETFSFFRGAPLPNLPTPTISLRSRSDQPAMVLRSISSTMA